MLVTLCLTMLQTQNQTPPQHYSPADRAQSAASFASLCPRISQVFIYTVEVFAVFFPICFSQFHFYKKMMSILYRATNKLSTELAGLIGHSPPIFTSRLINYIFTLGSSMFRIVKNSFEIPLACELGQVVCSLLNPLCPI